MSDATRLVRVGIGQLAVEHGPALLKATLGSCVGLALIWRAQRRYALAHCLLPASPTANPAPGARYVNQAVTSLLQALQAGPDAYGQIEAHVAGGANMMLRAPVAGRVAHIGQLNSEAALHELGKRGIRILSTDVGGNTARQIMLDCASGEVTVQHLAGFIRLDPD